MLSDIRATPSVGNRVLVVDDDALVRSGLEKLLQSEGYVVDVAPDGVDALALSGERRPDVVVTDLMMPNMDGWELIQKLHERHRELPVIVVTGKNDVQSAVTAMRDGAEDYVIKPIDFDALTRSIERVLARHAPRSEPPRAKIPSNYSSARLGDLLGDSEPMQRIYRLARQVAGAKAAVLITGESGTGKGALARAIHDASARSNKPFVAVHAAALVDSLLETELFGHERGAFTGADRRRIGRFEQADGGTLFLDEVGDIPASTQVKLLRVLQDRTFERVGGNDPIAVDVRLIAATNRDLANEVSDGRFREDLFYRLNVVHIEMPPLRVRGDDVMLLAHEFLKRFTAENKKSITGFSERAIEKLGKHPWAGNVRELENAIERAVVLCEGSRIEDDHLPFEQAPTKLTTAAKLEHIERDAIVSTLEAVDWSTTRAAELLGISVRTIQYRLHQYGLAGKRRRR